MVTSSEFPTSPFHNLPDAERYTSLHAGWVAGPDFVRTLPPASRDLRIAAFYRDE